MTLLDVNDNAPRFGANSEAPIVFDAGKAEGFSGGMLVRQVVAEDEDLGENGTVAYELVSGELLLFRKMKSKVKQILNYFVVVTIIINTQFLSHLMKLCWLK